MRQEVDWLELWRELVIATSSKKDGGHHFRRQAEFNYTPRTKPDCLLDFILKNVRSNDTVLEIGPGRGRWTIPLAKAAKSVTVIEPSELMLSALHRRSIDAAVTNIEMIHNSWETTDTGIHDVAVSAHAIYGSPDFANFIKKMSNHVSKKCYLAVRLPAFDGIIGELSLQVYGQRHDSPNAIIAFNALHSLGIRANMIVEDSSRRWHDDTFEAAFARAKRHLRLESVYCHDQLIRSTLTRRLNRRGNLLVWPDEMRSVLLWWGV